MAKISSPIGYIYSGYLAEGNSRTLRWLVTGTTTNGMELVLRGLTKDGQMGSGVARTWCHAVPTTTLVANATEEYHMAHRDQSERCVRDMERLAEDLSLPTKRDIATILLSSSKKDREYGIRAAAVFAAQVPPFEALMGCVRKLFDDSQFMEQAYAYNDVVDFAAAREQFKHVIATRVLVDALMNRAHNTRQGHVLSMRLIEAATTVLTEARTGDRASLMDAIENGRLWMNATGEFAHDDDSSEHLDMDGQHEDALEENSTR